MIFEKWVSAVWLSIIPIYNSEVAPPEVRGALVATQQLAICFGIMISFWID